MNADSSKDGVEVVQRLFKAGNKHDLPGFLACFAPDRLRVSAGQPPVPIIPSPGED